MVKSINWQVEVVNPMTNQVVNSATYNSIEDIHKEHSYLPISTWRNVCMGRSKVYTPFLRVSKNITCEPTSNQ